MSPLVQPLGPTRVVHGITVSPACIQLLDGCELRIVPAPARSVDLLRLIHGTMLYGFTGLSVGHLLTGYVGISQQASGSRVMRSLLQRTAQMQPAGLALLTRPDPYRLPVLRHLESAAIKRMAMRIRPLNAQSSAPTATKRLSPAERATADELAQQIADALTLFGLAGARNLAAWGYPNARDHAAALIHRLGGRAVDTHQVVQMLAVSGTSLTSKEPLFTARRDLVQREPESGNARIGVVKYRGLAVYYPAEITAPAVALADYAEQRRQRPVGPLPIPSPATTNWCRCRYCTPTTPFTPDGPAELAA